MDIYSVANQMKLERKTIFDLPIRVTFYARVSTTRDEQENSIDSQIEYFKNMIENNPNWTYVEGYVDRIRGESAENRTSFMKMIEDGKSGVFDLLLTKEVSRFARNTIDSLTYTRELLRAGAGVFFQNDNICTIDTDSELRLTIMSSIAADEVRKLSERIRWGHKRSIEKGRVVGNSRIIGYDKNNCKLVINEKEAEIVRLIFDMYSTGDNSTHAIAKELFKRGYRGVNGTEIHHNTVTGILRNPKYKGFYCGNKVKITDYRTRQQKFLPEDQWIMYKDETGDTVPAIVSEEIWDKCNRILLERSTVVKSREHSFKGNSVFTGKIWCTEDKRPYWRTSYSNSKQKSESVYQWICSEKKIHKADSCPSFSIKEDDLYSLLSDYLKQISINIDDYIATFLKIYKETDVNIGVQKQCKTINDKLNKAKLKRDKLLELYMDDTISKTEFAERNDSINSTILSIEDELVSINNQMSNTNETLDNIKNIEKYFHEMYNPNTTMTKEQVDEMVNTIIDRIDVTPKSETEMTLTIKLKTGMSSDVFIVRNGSRYGRRSGIITNVMFPKQQYIFNRKSPKIKGHLYIVTLTVNAGI